LEVLSISLFSALFQYAQAQKALSGFPRLAMGSRKGYYAFAPSRRGRGSETALSPP